MSQPANPHLNQLHDLVRALQDYTIEITPPQEIDSSSTTTPNSAGNSPQLDAATASPVTDDVSVPQESSQTTASVAFNATMDITDFFNANDNNDCSFSQNPEAPLCNITAFRCTNSQTSLTIPYDYEIHFAAGQAGSLSHYIQVVEGNILDQLATEMKLRDCDASLGGRRLQQTSLVKRFTGLSLMPRDALTTDECLLNFNPDQSGAEASQVECRSVKGALTVYTLLAAEENTLSEQSKQELQQTVLRSIESGMSNNQFIDSSSGERVAYIGDRSTFQSTSPSTTDSGWSGRSIGLVTAACVLMLVVIATVCYIRRSFMFGKGGQYVRDNSGSSVDSDSEPQTETVRQVGSHESSLAPNETQSAQGPRANNSVPESATSWTQTLSQDQGTECIEFEGASQFDPSMTSFEVATFDSEPLMEAPTDLGNYQFSYEQGISPINQTFDNLYEDVEIPMTFDDTSRGSAGLQGNIEY